MTEFNLPLLRKERDWVAEQRSLPYARSQLTMDFWSAEGEDVQMLGKDCGTTYCVAGHIAATTPGVRYVGGSVVQIGGALVDIQKWAGEQLGLSHSLSLDLFYSTDSEVLGVFDDIIAEAEAEERKEGHAA